MNKRTFGDKFVKFFLKLFRIKVSNDIERLLVQIFNFGIVGVVSTLIDFIFLYIFRDLCSFPLILSNTLAFTISVIYNYWASLMFVFDIDEKKSKKKTFFLFVIFSVFGLLINNLIVFVVTDILNIYYMLSKVIATIFVMIFNFVTRKKFLE